MNMLSRRGFMAGLGLVALTPAMARAQSAGQTAADPQIDGVLSYIALDPSDGQVLSERQADMPLPPASTLKTVTALYAMEQLGENHRFTTRVIRAGNMLILAGGGDPTLDTDGLASLAAMTAEAEKSSGLPAPTAFMVWGGALPRIAQLDPGQDAHLPYNPTISGMILNFNRVHLGWQREAQGYQMRLEARGTRQSPRAYTVMAEAVDRRAPLFVYDGSGKRERWTVARSSLGRSGGRWLPVRRPELFAGDAFQTLCRARGLVLPNPEVIEILPEGNEIARLESAPLRDIVVGMMKYSTNLTAEVLGLAASRASDIRQSALAMGDWLRRRGVGGNFSFRDHSGLSPASVMTSRAMARTIMQIGRARDLRDLMKHIPMGKGRNAAIGINAKTGTLNFISNLAGYAQDDSGRGLIFAIFCADQQRHMQSQGQELPEGVSTWTNRARAAQLALIDNWFAAGLARRMPTAGEPLPYSVEPMASAPLSASGEPLPLWPDAQAAIPGVGGAISSETPYQIKPSVIPGTGVFR